MLKTRSCSTISEDYADIYERDLTIEAMTFDCHWVKNGEFGSYG